MSLLAAGSLSACQLGDGGESDLMDEAQAAVAAEMLDPTSPLFTEVSVEDGSAVVCGYVNGKNSFGAYVGKRRFVWVSGGTAMIEDPTPGYTMRSGVRDPAQCMFDMQFDECKGTPTSDTIDTCMAGFGG